MRGHAASWLAWGLWASFAAGITGALLSRHAHGGLETDLAGGISILLAFGAFPTVGALVASRRPDNLVGWLFTAIGALMGVGFFAQEYAVYAFSVAPGTRPYGTLAAWVASWYWYPLIGLTVIFTPLLFPTGSPPSRRWRPVAWVAGPALATTTALAALAEKLEIEGGGDTDAENWGGGLVVDNPVGVSGLSDIEQGLPGVMLGILGLVCVVAAFASLVVRFRGSRGNERQQLKWFTYGSAVLVGQLLVDELLPITYNGTDLVFGLAVAALPVSAGIAILRYRLYDIDRIINRTVVYGLLTTFLGAVYFGVVVLLQAVLGRQVGTSPLAVAATTLGVAGLFRPARARIQGPLDPRFNRARFDAQQTIDSFAARLRDELELGALRTDLLAVVRATMQPTHVSLWLRDARPERRESQR